MTTEDVKSLEGLENNTGPFAHPVIPDMTKTGETGPRDEGEVARSLGGFALTAAGMRSGAYDQSPHYEGYYAHYSDIFENATPIGQMPRPFNEEGRIQPPEAPPEETFSFLDCPDLTAVVMQQILSDQGIEPDTEAYQSAERKLQQNTRQEVLATRVMGGSPETQAARENRRPEMEYVVSFLQEATNKVELFALTQTGANLAKDPFVSPTKSDPENETDGEKGYFSIEQYRWDDALIIKMLLAAGGFDLAKGGFENHTNVRARFHRGPNALTSGFLSHAQPPLEALTARDIFDQWPREEDESHPAEALQWYGVAMRSIEQDLWTEWLDAGTGRKGERQKSLPDFASDGMPNLLTRHNNIHDENANTLPGSEDGMDHYEIPRMFGAKHMPPQQNAILHGHLKDISGFYRDYESYHPDANASELEWANTKADQYEQLTAEHKKQFDDAFWVSYGEWKGYRNRALEGNKQGIDEGPIKFDDLSAEVFPLAFGIADEDQARVIKDNILDHYLGDQGLASTNPNHDDRPDDRLDISKYEEEFDDDQWRKQNCWPPLVYMAITGLEKYGYTEEANQILDTWMATQEQLFKDSGFFHEKSSYDSSYTTVKNGVYPPIEDGFAWTIGLYLWGLEKQTREGRLSDAPGTTKIDYGLAA